MKKQLLFMSLAVAALLVGCSKESDAPNGGVSAMHISAKATGSESPETKAPLTGTSLNSKQAQIYTTILPLEAYTGDKTTMFTNAYAAGTMTFADNRYSQYDGGFNGVALLPTDKSEVYMYGFYPMGWASASAGTYESLSHTFDGKTDLMTTWLSIADQQKIAYQGGVSGALPGKADFMFRHLLTCYNIRVVGVDAAQAAAWGRIKSINLKNREIDKISTGENLGYAYSAGGGAVSFYKLAGTPATPAYSDDLFEQAEFANMFTPTATVQSACYSMAEPVTVDAASATAELTLVVKTLDMDGGTETTVEIPVSLDQTKFATNGNSTRGYTVSITLSFAANAITPTASIGEWAEGDTYEQEMDPDSDPNPNPDPDPDPDPDPITLNVGDVINGGIVFWINTEKTHYKIVYAQPVKNNNGLWSAKSTYSVGCTDMTDGRVNVAKMEDYSRDHVSDVDANTKTTGVFSTDFPMASWCKALSATETPAGRWYMPALEELREIAVQSALLIPNGFEPGSLWTMSSSEVVSDLTSIHLWIGGNSFSTHFKTLRDNTRCIAYY